MSVLFRTSRLPFYHCCMDRGASRSLYLIVLAYSLSC